MSGPPLTPTGFHSHLKVLLSPSCELPFVTARSMSCAAASSQRLALLDSHCGLPYPESATCAADCTGRDCRYGRCARRFASDTGATRARVYARWLCERCSRELG